MPVTAAGPTRPGPVLLVDLPPEREAEVREALAGTGRELRGAASAAIDPVGASCIIALAPPEAPPGKIAGTGRDSRAIPVVGLCVSPIERCLEAIDPSGLAAIVGAAPRIDPVHLRATLEKIEGRGASGLGRYLPGDLPSVRIPLGRPDRREDILEAAASFLERAGVPRRLREDTLLVADELISNALFDAPRAAGITAPRSVAAEGNPAPAGIGEADIIVAGGGDRAGIAVTDPFGSLEARAVLGSLARCCRRGPDQILPKPGGAGMGLYTVLSVSSLLAFTVVPGRSTEAVAVVDRSSRTTPGRSLGIFFP